jgi:hypothetical protein
MADRDSPHIGSAERGANEAPVSQLGDEICRAVLVNSTPGGHRRYDLAMQAPVPAPHGKPQPKIAWGGFVLGQYGIWGLFVLFAAMTFLSINGHKMKATRTNEVVRTVADNDPRHPVHVAGDILSKDIGAPHLKPGQFLMVKQVSEVYAIREYSIFKSKKMRYEPGWTETPEDPATFQDPARRGDRRYQKAETSTTQTPADARIVQDGKEYKLDMADVELPMDMAPKAPLLEEMVSEHKTWEHHDNGDVTATVYAQRDCITAPTLGCQRVKLSVVRKPTGVMTCAGKLEGDRITKFDGSLKCHLGDMSSVQGEYAFGGSYSRFFLTIQRTLCMLGVWLGLFMTVRPLRRLLRFAPALAKWGAFKLSGVVATAVGITTYVLHIGGIAFAIVTVVALLVASREPALPQAG